MAELRKLNLCDIDPPDDAMRQRMDPEKLNELAESMAATGLQQPITVVPCELRYKIMLGHRRYVAARHLCWTVIDAIIKQPGDVELEAAMLAENSGREDVNAADEAIWYGRLMEKLSLDTDELAQKLHRSRDYVEDRVRLLQQDDKVFEAILNRQINFSVARELNKISEQGMRRYYLDAAVRGGTSARVVASWVAQWKANSQPLPETPAAVPGAQAADAPAADAPAPYRHACEFCGGDKDPYNLVTILVHKWELDFIRRQMQQPQTESQQ